MTETKNDLNLELMKTEFKEDDAEKKKPNKLIGEKSCRLSLI